MLVSIDTVIETYVHDCQYPLHGLDLGVVCALFKLSLEVLLRWLVGIVLQNQAVRILDIGRHRGRGSASRAEDSQVQKCSVAPETDHLLVRGRGERKGFRTVHAYGFTCAM